MLPGRLDRCDVCGTLLAVGRDDPGCRTIFVHGALSPQTVVLTDLQVAASDDGPHALLHATLRAEGRLDPAYAGDDEAKRAS